MHMLLLILTANISYVTSIYQRKCTTVNTRVSSTMPTEAQHAIFLYVRRTVRSNVLLFTQY